MYKLVHVARISEQHGYQAAPTWRVTKNIFAAQKKETKLLDLHHALASPEAPILPKPSNTQ